MGAIWRWISLSHGWLFIHATRMMCMPRRCHFALDAMDHFVLVYMLSTLHVPGMCYLIFLPVMHTRTAIKVLHRGSFSEHIAGCPSRLSGGPTRSVHASVLPSPVLTRAYSFRISSGRGGIAPPVQRGAAHPRTNPAARAAGGEPPPLKAPRALRAPRKCRSSSGPGGRTPLSQLHRCGTVLGIRRSMSCCLGPASGSALVPDALPARAHTLTH